MRKRDIACRRALTPVPREQVCSWFLRRHHRVRLHLRCLSYHLPFIHAPTSRSHDHPPSLTVPPETVRRHRKPPNTSTSQFTACFTHGLPSSPVDFRPGETRIFPRGLLLQEHCETATHFPRTVAPTSNAGALRSKRGMLCLSCVCLPALACALIKAGLPNARLVRDATPPPYRARPVSPHRSYIT